jgi:hypothetical protein
MKNKGTQAWRKRNKEKLEGSESMNGKGMLIRNSHLILVLTTIKPKTIAKIRVTLKMSRSISKSQMKRERIICKASRIMRNMVTTKRMVRALKCNNILMMVPTWIMRIVVIPLQTRKKTTKVVKSTTTTTLNPNSQRMKTCRVQGTSSYNIPQ